MELPLGYSFRTNWVTYWGDLTIAPHLTQSCAAPIRSLSWASSVLAPMPSLAASKTRIGSPKVIRLRAITAIAATFSCACGGRASVENGEDYDPPTLPPTAAPEKDGCAAPLIVPQGQAWVGGMHWHDGELVPNDCDTPGGTVGIRLFVPDFFLDQDEVTNACYWHCVDAGVCLPPHSVPDGPDAPWDDPSVREYPVYQIDGAMAEAFCAWRGGRLASIAELMRAEHGGAVAVLNPALTELWLACASDQKPPDCDVVSDLVWSWPAPVRSWELDIGPFGHYDLAGSVPELTMTHLPGTTEERDALCSIPLDTTDPQTLGSGGRAGFVLAGNLLEPPVEGGQVWWVVQGAVDDQGNPVPLEGGVRCAYDPL